jgi:hypothetical protein
MFDSESGTTIQRTRPKGGFLHLWGSGRFLVEMLADAPALLLPFSMNISLERPPPLPVTAPLPVRLQTTIPIIYNLWLVSSTQVDIWSLSGPYAPVKD